jgi:hypothetical protein
MWACPPWHDIEFPPRGRRDDLLRRTGRGDVEGLTLPLNTHNRRGPDLLEQRLSATTQAVQEYFFEIW